MIVRSSASSGTLEDTTTAEGSPLRNARSVPLTWNVSQGPKTYEASHHSVIAEMAEGIRIGRGVAQLREACRVLLEFDGGVLGGGGAEVH